MKKIFALALAALMTAGMTTVAFAATTAEVNLAKDTDTSMFVDDNDDGKFASGEERYEVQAGQAVTFSKPDGGKKVALPLYDKNGTAIDDKDAIKGYKVKADWKVGDLDEKPVIELVKIDNNYIYAVTFTLPEAADVKATDLAGEISVYKNSSDLKDTNANKDYITVKIGGDYGYAEDTLYGWGDLKDAEIVVFKTALTGGTGLEGEETLTFGDFEFEVDVTGQGKLNLKNNVDFNKEFAAMYDYANIDFITFEKEPTFNKNGTAYIYADEDAYIYEVTADGAKEIKGLKWDEDYEAWTFKTRTLKAYAISDVELDEKTATEDKDDASSTTDGGKKNPDTGR